MSEVAKILKEIVQKYPAVLTDDKKLKSILKDFFPDDKRLQNQLFMVSEEGILDDMNGATEIKKFKLLGYIHGLSNDYGIPETMAKSAVYMWIEALGILAEDVVVEDSSKSSGAKKNGNVIDYSDVSIDDAESKGTVIKFSGFGQKIIPNVKLEKRVYIVKTTSASGCIIAEFVDKNGKSKTVANTGKSPGEDMFNPTMSSLDFNHEGIIKIENCSREWTVEMIPM